MASADQPACAALPAGRRGPRPVQLSHRGVSVERRDGAHGPRYIGRYTLPSGKRPSLPGRASWQEAFDAARAEQSKLDRARYRDPGGGRMTFLELVVEHYLPLQGDLSPVTCKNIASHLGDATGRPRGQGVKAERAARFALLAVFGALPLQTISPQHVRVWQAGLVREHYQRSSILAKRALLRAILEHARVNGWLELNPVDPVPLPRARQRADAGRVLTPEEWAVLRPRLTGTATGLLVDLTLDTGLRFSEVAALRACDLVDADARDPQHVWVRQAVTWPGVRYSCSGQAWEIKEPKSRRFRRVAVSPSLFGALRSYVEQCGLTPSALLFDTARVRAEHARQRAADPLPERFPHGRYLDPATGRSGEHGTPDAYRLGCRCPYCRNAYSQYCFWRARQRGRTAAEPWRDPGFLTSRSDAVDPVSHSWFTSVVWRPAVADAALGWSPTFHNLRHAMVSWSLEGGATARSAQLDAGHASLRTTEVYVHRLDDRVSDTRLSAMAVMYERLRDAAPVQRASRPG